MADSAACRVLIDVFAEDQAHEAFIRPLVARIAREESKTVDVRVRSARGGHGKALSEFSTYQKLVIAGQEYPDIIVVCIDGNCKGTVAARNEIRGRVRTEFAGRVVIASPNPHIERWYIADPDSFQSVVGSRPALGKRKCERGLYKGRLAQSIAAGGHQRTLGGVEFAEEIVEGMDFYRAGRNETSLRHCVDQVRQRLRLD